MSTNVIAAMYGRLKTADWSGQLDATDPGVAVAAEEAGEQQAVGDDEPPHHHLAPAGVERADAAVPSIDRLLSRCAISPPRRHADDRSEHDDEREQEQPDAAEVVPERPADASIRSRPSVARGLDRRPRRSSPGPTAAQASTHQRRDDVEPRARRSACRRTSCAGSSAGRRRRRPAAATRRPARRGTRTPSADGGRHAALADARPARSRSPPCAPPRAPRCSRQAGRRVQPEHRRQRDRAASPLRCAARCTRS